MNRLFFFVQVWLARTVGNPQQRQPATNFLCITNCYVIFMHLISRGHPFSINFIGKSTLLVARACLVQLWVDTS
jgi:hypothetical protein